MAFNFGAFVGGLSTGLATSIKEEEERQFKFDMLAEEEATKMRLQRSAERKAQRAKDRELAGKLSAMGFDKGRVSYIISQGAGYAEGIYDLAAVASAKGNDPNTLFKYSDSMDEFRSFVGPERDGIRGDIDLGKIPTDFDFTSAFTQDIELTTSILTEKPDTEKFTNLESLYTSIANQQLDTTTGSDEWKTLERKKMKIRDDMNAIAKSKDTSSPSDPKNIIGENAFNADMKTARTGVFGKYNLLTLDGELASMEEGRQVEATIAELDAVITVKNSYDNLQGDGILKQQGTARANAAITSAVASLNSLSKQVVAAHKANPDEGLGLKFKMPEGKNNFELTNMLKAAKGGNNAELNEFIEFVDGLEYGDVIQVDGNIAVYTGLTQYYTKLGVDNKVISMPLLFVGDNLSDKYTFDTIVN